MTTSDLVESWRRERRLTVNDLARGSFLSPRTYRDRRRRGDWRSDDLSAIARVLAIRVEWLS